MNYVTDTVSPSGVCGYIQPHDPDDPDDPVNIHRESTKQKTPPPPKEPKTK